jgi:diguanylate cyclase (GGDEF)-like protein
MFRLGEVLTVGVLAPLLGGHYFGGILTGVARSASAAGCRAIAVQTFDPGMTAIDYLSVSDFDRWAAWQDVSGFVVILNAVGSGYLDALSRAGKPVVKIGQASPGVVCPVVVPDNRSGARAAVEHLIGHGHRRIAFVGWIAQEDPAERYQVYRDTLVAHGIEPDPRLFFDTGNNFPTGGARAARAMLAAGMPSTAVFSATDFNAIGLMEALSQADRRLPEDQAVASFDGVAAGAHVSPGLTTSEARFDNVGEVAFDLLLRALRGDAVAPERYYVPSSFIVRESCGCPVRHDSSDQLRRQVQELHEVSNSLESMLNSQYRISMDLLRSNEEDPRALDWLCRAQASVGCLGLWQRDRRQPPGCDPELDVVGTFDRDPRRRRVPGGSLRVSAFPPPEVTRADSRNPDDMTYVVPVKTQSRDWGLLSFVGPIDTHLPSVVETTNQWAALLSVALDHEAVLKSLREREEQQRRAALYDSLTGLPNRALFLERIRDALRRAEDPPGYQFAVLFLDLDGFKLVNDSLGHLAGDRLLREVAERLRAHVREVDTPARFGGDEFAILIDGIADTAALIALARHLQAVIAAPLTTVGQRVVVSASIGIAPSSLHYDSAEDLLRDADIAMYRAKSAHKGTYTVFDASMHAEAVARLHTEAELRHAIEHDELDLHYQPIVALPGGDIIAFEALLRWNHPGRGLLTPGQFLPVAEDAGLMPRIDSWVLHTVCRQLARWRRAHAVAENRWVSLNISDGYFWSGGLAQEILTCLRTNNVPPQCLALEITERVIMRSVASARAMLERLHDNGVQLHVDDFGTGYSSLGALHQLPIDVLKIDRSFVANLATSDKSRRLVRSIIVMGANLGIDVIAEGIETGEQSVQLHELGCRYGQGYWFAQPLPAALAVPQPAGESPTRRG